MPFSFFKYYYSLTAGRPVPLKASGELQLQEVSSFSVGVMSSLLDANSNGKQRNNQTTEQPNNRTTSSCKFMHAHAAGCIFCKASLLHVAAFLGRFSAMLRMLQVQRQHVACATMMSNKICSCRSGIWSQVGAGRPKRYISALIGLSPHVVAGLK